MQDILISRDGNGKIRVVNILCEWNDKLHAYIISRNTCQLGGKITEQPDITISKGKVKRTVTEQATLEYNSKVKSYLDKGYKKITEFGFTSLNEFDPEKVMPEQVVDQNGAKPPMLAKKYKEVKDSVFKEKHWASRKLDGVRCQIRLVDDHLITSSRGGGNYDIPSKFVLADPIMTQIFEDSLIKDLLGNRPFSLDGELYIHGKPLPYISGICRKITTVDGHKNLVFNIYDIAVDDIIFEDRLKVLNRISNMYHSDKFVVSEHIETNSWEEIKNLHDKWVEEGFEGCVIRNPNKEYGYGKKDSRMIKIKEYDDDEFIITGMIEKLREEDFVFNMITHDGKPFEAKPKGTREQRQEYRDNIKTLIGQKGTIQYFGYSPDGIPNLPIFKYVRYGDDIS